MPNWNKRHRRRLLDDVQARLALGERGGPHAGGGGGSSTSADAQPPCHAAPPLAARRGRRLLAGGVVVAHALLLLLASSLHSASRRLTSDESVSTFAVSSLRSRKPSGGSHAVWCVVSEMKYMRWVAGSSASIHSELMAELMATEAIVRNSLTLPRRGLQRSKRRERDLGTRLRWRVRSRTRFRSNGYARARSSLPLYFPRYRAGVGPQREPGLPSDASESPRLFISGIPGVGPAAAPGAGAAAHAAAAAAHHHHLLLHHLLLHVLLLHHHLHRHLLLRGAPRRRRHPPRSWRRSPY